jgi:hypothetical protein
MDKEVGRADAQGNCMWAFERLCRGHPARDSRAGRPRHVDATLTCNCPGPMPKRSKRTSGPGLPAGQSHVSMDFAFGVPRLRGSDRSFPPEGGTPNFPHRAGGAHAIALGSAVSCLTCLTRQATTAPDSWSGSHGAFGKKSKGALYGQGRETPHLMRVHIVIVRWRRGEALAKCRLQAVRDRTHVQFVWRRRRQGP